MVDKTLQWHKLSSHINDIPWGVNNMAVVEVADRKFTLVKKGDAVFACAATCPHAGGVLADGYVDGVGNIVCPLHRYKFNPLNGRNVTGEGYHLKTYAIDVRADGIYIGLAMEKPYLF